MKNERIRIELRLPKQIVELIDEYKEENGVATRTASISEMIRIAANRITEQKK